MQAGKEVSLLSACCSRQHTQLLAFSGLTPYTIPYGVVEYNDSCLSDEENKAQRSAVLSSWTDGSTADSLLFTF